jgi:1-phosphatidylinositol phosphodiesterase
MRKTHSVNRLTSLVAFGLLVAVGFVTTHAREPGTSFRARPREISIQKYSGWMSRLPGSVPLSQLSLPGTHDSCALHDGLSFGFAKCQSWKLADQLKAGTRFIDIRCRHVGDRFLIYHGVIDQRMTFKQVCDVCREFLQEHPSECIVMSVKEESTPENNSRSFGETFADLTKNDCKLWHVSREIPELGSVRTRIVLVDRVGTLGGLNWDLMQRQDQYTAPLEQKTKLIRDHFEKAVKAGDHRWFINFCSGTVPGSLLTPRQYALKSNEIALDFLRQQTADAPVRLGTIVMDFPSKELIERIVETNFACKKTK